ncbi:MAG: hypothetical protein H6818_05510 [Phycisphaerales bacterium]|nr:hypothetical protein [Phycisphaerales bacterium]
MKNVRRQSSSFRPAARRGSVMILVLSMLALLALVGLALIARTHTDSRRTFTQSDATSIDDAMDGVVRAVSDRLYQDIWGAINDPTLAEYYRPLSNITPPGGLPTNPNFYGILENNEVGDKPGENDRWLASLLPHYVGDVTLLDPAGNGTTTIVESNVFAFDNVSYIGQDLLIPPATATFPGSPFMWVDNARNPGGPQPQLYSVDTANTRSSLRNIPILLTPAPGPNPIAPNLTGATTNQTIRQARANWKKNHQPWLENVANTGLTPDVRPQFPYFDTNRDGLPDLYDADGDGLPDSPLSLVIPIDSGDPNRRKTLYAAVRIVDHNAMLNVNTASSLRRPDSTLTFDGTASGLTRRGRRATEILLDGAVHTGDWYRSNRVGILTGRRLTGSANPTTAPVNPVQYDNDIVRKLLLGGQSNVTSYYPFDIDDESTLRHRGRLVPYDHRTDISEPATDYSTIDRTLRSTNLWSREVAAAWTDEYVGAPRWSRLNATQESYDDVNGNVGWRRLIDEDDPAFVRKPLMTTVNGEVRMPPDITRPNMPTAGIPTPIASRTLADANIDARLRQLWSIGMNWPVLIDANSDLAGLIATEAPLAGPTVDSVLNGSLINRFVIPTGQMPPAWARVMPVDLNMTFGGNLNDQEVKDVKADFIRYAAAAMYFALDGVNVYQGIDLRANGRLMQEYLAWQFALNLADYRDADSVPTSIEWPTQPGVRITGVERQPFFTEAYTHLIAGAAPLSGPSTGPGSGQSDKWFFAVELFIPPGWDIDSQNLYLRSPGTSAGLRPLGSFLNHLSGNALASENGGIMLGGPAQFVDPGDGDHGHYYVFTGPTTYEPASFAASDALYRNNAYFDNQFRIATDGHGRVELVYSTTGVENDPTNVVLDVIGPKFAGGALASNTSSGDGEWAFHNPTMPEGSEHAFSLRRSTKGWRFTTAWHAYSRIPGNNPNAPAFAVSLGRPNAPTPQLVNKIPESVWPSLTPYGNNAALIDTFASGVPFDAFDSVADLSRQFIVGPAKRTASPILTAAFSNLNLGIDNAPTTLVLARILQTTTLGDLPSAPEDRVAAGRVDFFKASKIGTGTNAPAWTWRLFDYAVASGYMYDGVDNDGDGFVDLFDPTEAWDVTFKETGHVNMNTAPATVLRSVPNMSLLPNSPEILAQYGATPPLEDQIAALSSASPGTYYDFASALVALRENRSVPIRLYDTTQSRLSIAAIAQVTPSGPSTGPGAAPMNTTQRDGAFYGPIEMSRLRGNKVSDAVSNANEMFAIDRLNSNSALPLVADQHLAPDYRIRPERGVSDYVPLHGATQAIPGYAGADPAGVETDPRDAAGIRGRDIYLSRVSNSLTTRSDVFTAYVALIDEDGNYVRRAQVTLDRAPCFRERRGMGGLDQPVSPKILLIEDSSYTNDLK